MSHVGESGYHCQNVQTYVFIYCLFNDALSSSDHVVLNNRMISED